MTTHELNKSQMEQLKSNLFYNQEEWSDALTDKECDAITNAVNWNEIPDEIVHKNYDGVDFVPDDFFQEEKEITTVEDLSPVTIVSNGIRVRTIDEDFTILPNNLGGHFKQYQWYDMIKLLKKKHITTFNVKHAHIIAAYKKEIDRLLEEIGGECIGGHCSWCLTEHDNRTAYFWGGDELISFASKNLPLYVRPIVTNN